MNEVTQVPTYDVGRAERLFGLARVKTNAGDYRDEKRQAAKDLLDIVAAAARKHYDETHLTRRSGDVFWRLSTDDRSIPAFVSLHFRDDKFSVGGRVWAGRDQAIPDVDVEGLVYDPTDKRWVVDLPIDEKDDALSRVVQALTAQMKLVAEQDTAKRFE